MVFDMSDFIQKLCEIEPDWSTWVSATKTRNWVEEDPLLDWLDLYGSAHGFVKDTEQPNYIPEADFSKFVKRKGEEFEQRVCDLLDSQLESAGLERMARIATSGQDAQSRERWIETVKEMQRGTPVIAQGILWDWERGTYGVPDLLVRSDILNCLCEEVLDYPEANAGAPALGLSDYHYVVVEIKFRVFDLAFNWEAGNDAKHYKAQLAICNAALGILQGYTPTMAFFIGRGWEKGTGENSSKSTSCLNRLIPVSLPEQAQYRRPSINWLDKAMEAVQWVRRVRQEGKSWQVLPTPSNRWLHPNMKNGQDAPWHGAKRSISEAIGEPTQIWNLGVDVRNALIEASSADWRHPEFRFDIAAPGQNATSDRLRQMLRINRDPNGPLYHPKLVDWAREEWAVPEALEFFVDFETTSNLDDDFSSLPNAGGQPLIFMIGCGHWEPVEGDPGVKGQWMLHPERRRWVFKVFYTDSLTEDEEKRIIFEWCQYMEEVRKRTPRAPERPKVFHWSPAETSTYSMGATSAFVRHLQPAGWPTPNWYDFLGNVVKQRGTSNAFYVRGAWGFGLKAIGKALHQHGFIQTLWMDGPADGLAAMGGSWACYRVAQENGIAVTDVVFKDIAGNPHHLFQEVIKYNEIDCQVMAESIMFIRSLS
jgi:hypothetical protein